MATPLPLTEKLLEMVRASDRTGFALRQYAMHLLSELPNYNWCGIYRLEGETLVLDAFVGEETEHTHIPVGRGVCGTAVADRRNQVVEDVRDLENYLACSVTTRSEIVVLIERDGVILGQIDIDGHVVGAFGREDEAFLTELATLLAEKWEDEPTSRSETVRK